MPRSGVDPAVRRRIEHELQHPQDPPRSRAAIAREHGVGPRTVTRYAEQLGIVNADLWRTDSIRAATVSALDRRRAERSKLADRLQAEADRLLDQMDGPFLVFNFGGKDNDYNEHHLDRAPTGDVKNLMHSVGIAIDRALAIDKNDAQPDDTNADDTLARLFDGLAGAYHAITGQPVTAGRPADEEDPDA